MSSNVLQVIANCSLSSFNISNPAMSHNVLPHRCKVSSFQTQSPAKQAKSPAELGLTNFVIHISCKLLFHKHKTVHDLRNHEIYEKSAAN